MLPQETVRHATAADSAAIARIYNHYVRQTVVTFEEEELPADAMTARIDEVKAASLPWLVVEVAGAVVGYAYAGKWKARSAYRNSVESTVYLDASSTARGYGKLLYGQLLDELSGRSLHVAIGGIALPNPASVALHESFGFRHMGTFSEIGFKQGRWVDVGYWQKIL